jgi:hypothetical protein
MIERDALTSGSAFWQVDHHHPPALIAANSVLAFATNRHTVAASSE